VSLPLQQISPVDTHCRNLDQHLVRSRFWGLDFPQFEHVRRSGFPCNDGFHAPQRAIGRRRCRLGSGCSPRWRVPKSGLGEVA
jgi:hypothetical protein